MIHLRLSKLAEVCRGQVLQPTARAEIIGVSTDSRTVTPGQAFFALQGERFDGHNFAGDAAARGAAAVVVSRDVRDALPDSCGAVRVEDTVSALGRLARWYRDHFDIPVAAVTGSVGKTTTKEMLAAILRRSRRVLASERTENNEIAVSATLLKLEPDHDVCVLEFAMRALREIAWLTETARPTVGIVTNVGQSHIGLLGTRKRIAAAKGELAIALPPDGVAVLNADDDYVLRMREITKARVVTFAQDAPADVVAASVALDGWNGAEFTLRTADGTHPVRLSVPGRHNVVNALAASAAALTMGATVEDIAAALADFEPQPGRTNVLRAPAGYVIIDDTYNASPSSVVAALDLMAHCPVEGRRLVALGDMLELGEHSPREHRQLAKEMARSQVRLLATLGERARLTAEAAAEVEGLEAHAFATRDDLVGFLADALRPGDAVLVKGSRAMAMEAVVRRLLSD